MGNALAKRGPKPTEDRDSLRRYILARDGGLADTVDLLFRIRDDELESWVPEKGKMLRQPLDPKLRKDAAVYLLEFVHGKPKESVEVKTKQDRPLVEYSTEQLRAAVKQRLLEAPDVVDAEVSDPDPDEES